MKPKESILCCIGRTPLVLLGRCFPNRQFTVYAKLEGASLGGSSKDRSAYAMIQHALESGIVAPGDTIVESSSGNMAIGLAQTCCCLGLQLVCVLDPKTTPQNVAILRAYGAEVVTVAEPDPATGEFLLARLAKVKELVEDRPGSFWPNQYASEYNARAHRTTMREIVEALDSQVDVLVCPTSTCGTLRGCSEYVREHGLDTNLVLKQACSGRSDAIRRRAWMSAVSLAA